MHAISLLQICFHLYAVFSLGRFLFHSVLGFGLNVGKGIDPIPWACNYCNQGGGGGGGGGGGEESVGVELADSIGSNGDIHGSLSA